MTPLPRTNRHSSPFTEPHTEPEDRGGERGFRGHSGGTTTPTPLPRHTHTHTHTHTHGIHIIQFHRLQSHRFTHPNTNQYRKYKLNCTVPYPHTVLYI